MSELAKQLFGAMKGVVEGIRQSGPGEAIGKVFDGIQGFPALNDMANHGRTEIAAALFSGSNAFVMYQRGSHDQPKEPSPEVHQPEITQSKGIHM